MYDLAPAHTGRRGRPAKHGKRLSVETSYYEQKTFWPFCNYMVRSCKGIEMLVNLINISYCAMKILPYQKNNWTSIFRQISPSFNHYSSHQILIQARILAHCSHKLKNAVQSSQIVLHSNFKQLYYSYDYILSWNVLEITSICCSFVRSMNLTA